ncbi:MAG: UDP-N-acetylmuramate dehydrogenase [Thermodesulfovibrionales bacterium]|nr:UDP-N-acetylmuramate dehydrogenase [Thermodesulfovibrionales bacterium]
MISKILTEFCRQYNIEMSFNVPMAPYTSLKIGGKAEIALFPEEEKLPSLIKFLSEQKVPFIFLGFGTNVLVLDSGIEGAVIFTNKLNKILNITKEGQLEAQSGCSLTKLINTAAKFGFSGMEGLVGIPGSLGGAIAGNAGSFSYEIANVIDSITILTADGINKTLKKKDLYFQYRRSSLSPDSLILRATLSFTVEDSYAVKKRISEFYKEKRQKQPLDKHSAGCVFKNPKDSYAGKLIEEAGCKGMRVGGVEVSSLHANYFINANNGTSEDFLSLMEITQKRVSDFFGIELEPEIKIIGKNI